MVWCGVRVGAAAFVLGLSVAGPQALGVANADTGGGDSTTASSAPASSGGAATTDSKRTVRTRQRRADAGVRQTTASGGAAQSPILASPTAADAVPRSAAAAAAATPRRAAASRSANRAQTAGARVPQQSVPSAAAATPAAPVASRASAVTKALVSGVQPLVVSASAATPAVSIQSLVSGVQQSEGTPVDDSGRSNSRGSLKLTLGVVDEQIDSAIYGVLDAISNCLSRFPPNPITDFLQGALLLVRRTFFDQTPTLTPVQTTGQQGGEISGTLGGFDPEGEPITYSVITAPQDGAVTLKPDGTFIYTPGSDFDGSDAFVVAATDKSSSVNVIAANTVSIALQGNWIDPTRPANAYAFVEVDQAAAPQVTTDAEINFNFSWAELTLKNPYTPAQAQEAWGGKNYKNSDQYVDMQWAAFALADNFIPKGSVTLNIAIGVRSGGLATTRGVLDPQTGFTMTDVQKKVITGTTDDDIDATLLLNFVNLSFWKNLGTDDDSLWRRYPAEWAHFNAQLEADQFNFESVVTHELLHAFGFWDEVSEPGKNTGTKWSTFDQFIGNAQKDAAISKGTSTTPYVWDTDFDANLVSGNWQDGLYFIGEHAMAAFGGKPVPLYSPKKYSGGSSVGHTSDFYFTDRTQPTATSFIQLMNAIDTAGKWVPVDLSKVELGIMQDLGYTISPNALKATPTATASL